MPRSSIFTSASSTSSGSGPPPSRSSRSSCGPSSSQKYGSVKYNRVASSPKEDVHETFSNPIMPVSAPFVVEVDDVAEEDEKMELQGSHNRMEAKKQNATNSTEAGLSSGSNLMSTLEAPSTIMVPTTRQKHLSLLPPSLHISFDVEPENSRTQHFAMNMPLSQSSDNVRNYRYGSVSSSGGGQHTPPRRAGVYRQGQRRNFFQQSEIAQISAGYMRANGAVQQFRVGLRLSIRTCPRQLVTRLFDSSASWQRPRRVRPSFQKFSTNNAARRRTRR